MQHLQLIADPLINKESNTMRRTVMASPKTFYKTAGTAPYSQVINFEIPKEYNNLSQLFVEITATTAGDNTNHALYTGCWWFKKMTLQTKSTVPLTSNTNNYLSVRTDELAQSPINSLVADAMEPSPTFNATTSVFYVPFFAWFSDSIDKMIPTFYLEQLELVCEVAGSKEEMGLPADVTSASYRLVCEYHDDLVRRSNPFPLSWEVYDVFEEMPVLNNGTNNYTETTMSCSFPVFVNHSLIKDSSQQMGTITNVSYKVAGEEIVNTSPRIMFSLASGGETLPTDVNMEPNSATSYYFSRLRGNQARGPKNTDFVNFTRSMYPCVIRADHTADATKYLYNVCEYKVILDIDSEGRVSRRVSNKLNLNKVITGAGAIGS